MIKKIKNNLLDFYNAIATKTNFRALLIVMIITYALTCSLYMCLIVFSLQLIAIYLIYQILKNQK